MPSPVDVLRQLSGEIGNDPNVNAPIDDSGVLGSSISNLLMALGTGLLSENEPGRGIGRGLAAFPGLERQRRKERLVNRRSRMRGLSTLADIEGKIHDITTTPDRGGLVTAQTDLAEARRKKVEAETGFLTGTDALTTNVPGAGGVSRPESRRTSIFDSADRITGFTQTAGAAIDPVTQIFGVRSISPESRRAIQEFDITTKDFEKALTNNPRFPQAEMERVRKLASRGALKSADDFRTNMFEMDQTLANREAILRQNIVDPRMTKSDKSKSRQALRHVIILRRKIGAPQTKEELMQSLDNPGAEVRAEQNRVLRANQDRQRAAREELERRRRARGQ